MREANLCREGEASPSKDSRNIYYDERGMMKESRAGKSEAWLVYTYDENNQRTSKYNTDRYLEWMNFNEYFGIYFSIPNKASGGQWQKSIMLGNTRIVTKIDQQHSAVQHYRDERTFYYLSDHIGNTTLITDYKGDVFQSTDYTPYGERWVENTGRNPEGYCLPFKFAGKTLDTETGYYYFGARYYEPRTSIWLTADPAMGEYFDNTSLGDGGVFNYVNLNPYHYGGNNPIKYVDPDGRNAKYYVDAENNTINITLDIVIYGKGATKKVAAVFEEGINNTWGGCHSAIVGEDSYSVNIHSSVSVGVLPSNYSQNSDKNYVEVDPNTPRSFVRGDGVSGQWRSAKRARKSTSSGNDAPHEAGHLMGLSDRYTDIKFKKKDGSAETYVRSVPHRGWGSNIMANIDGAVDQRNIDGILKGIDISKKSGIIKARGFKY